MLEKKPLKTQFLLSFILIIIISIVATVITYFVGFNIYTQLEFKKLNPANYYEGKIPAIEDYIRKKVMLY